MAEKSLFYNAFEDSAYVTGYDRNYNADDISDWLSMSFETGVVKGSLKVIEADGFGVNVEAGRASIKGKGYLNDSLKYLPIETAPTGANARYDLIVLRYDNTQTKNARLTQSIYIKGTNNIPTVNSLTRNDTIYDLLLAYIIVDPSATTIPQNKIIDCRGNTELCPYYTAVKGYDDYYDAIILPYKSEITVGSLTTNVITTLSSKLYNQKYSIINVYANGTLKRADEYTISTTSDFITINFTQSVVAGTKISIHLDNFIDGEGLSTAIDDYTNWSNAVELLEQKNEYNYMCNGINDNVIISQLARAYLGGSGNGSAKINVIGTYGMTASVKGSGSVSDPYCWLNLNVSSGALPSRKLTVDFSRSSEIAPTIANGSFNVIFDGTNLDIIGANVIASNSNTNTTIRIQNSSTGVIYFEKCRFWLTGYRDSLVGIRGTYTNCRGSVANIIGNSYCFLTNNESVIKVIGGEYYAYTSATSAKSAVVGQSGADAIAILYGVVAPTVARSGFYQTNAIYQVAGGNFINCTDLVSTLPLSVVASFNNLRGTITKNKNNVS